MKCLSAVLLVLLSGCVGGSDSFAGSRADPLILGHDQIAGLILMLSVIGDRAEGGLVLDWTDSLLRSHPRAILLM